MRSSVSMSIRVLFTSNSSARRSINAGPLKSPQNDFRFLDQPLPVRRPYPIVAGDTQQCQADLKRNSRRHRPECALAVGKIAAVFPQKMSDERFGGGLVPHRLQIEVLQLSGDATHVE